jgi:hypothetical protein
MPPTFLLLDARSPIEIERCRKKLLSVLSRALSTTPSDGSFTVSAKSYSIENVYNSGPTEKWSENKTTCWDVKAIRGSENGFARPIAGIGENAWKNTNRHSAVKAEKLVVHPSSNRPIHFRLHVTGIDPRHKPHPLSLLPSGPDEVRDRLLRGGRSAVKSVFGVTL